MNIEHTEPKMKADEFDVYNEGRTPIEVVLRDGARETWTLKKVGLDVVHQFSKQPPSLLEKAQAYVEGKSRDDIVKLSPESQLDIVRQGGALNRPLFKAFSDEQEKDNAVWGIDQKKLLSHALTVALMAQMDPQLKQLLGDGAVSSPASNATDTPGTPS